MTQVVVTSSERFESSSSLRWQKVKTLLGIAVGLSPVSRDEALRAICAGDEDLFYEVRSLLELESKVQGFIEAPFLHDSFGGPWSPVVGESIGSYRLVREIGRGGMGVVFLGYSGEGSYTRNVAVKLIRKEMQTEDTLRRFFAEQRILEHLNHPNIAQLFEGGTSKEGIPYLVMEYVQGSPIDSYCDQRRLPLVERVRLVRQVCSAVDFAHRNLVIHRDLKPSNILVTEEGSPKLLDFGIAKLLDGDGMMPTVGPHPLTPEYASPEQILAEPVTIASDVYALGVLLYALLTGSPPYSATLGTTNSLAQIFREEEPEKPSEAVGKVKKRHWNSVECLTPDLIGWQRRCTTQVLRRQLSGDLDAIVLTAMHRNPNRRYASVAQLSDDLERFLEGRMIRARRYRMTYRTTAFLRSKGPWAGILVMLPLLLVSCLLIFSLTRKFAEEREKTEHLLGALHHLVERSEKGYVGARRHLMALMADREPSLSERGFIFCSLPPESFSTFVVQSGLITELGDAKILSEQPPPKKQEGIKVSDLGKVLSGVVILKAEVPEALLARADPGRDSSKDICLWLRVAEKNAPPKGAGLGTADIEKGRKRLDRSRRCVLDQGWDCSSATQGLASLAFR